MNPKNKINLIDNCNLAALSHCSSFIIHLQISTINLHVKDDPFAKVKNYTIETKYLHSPKMFVIFCFKPHKNLLKKLAEVESSADEYCTQYSKIQCQNHRKCNSLNLHLTDSKDHLLFQTVDIVQHIINFLIFQGQCPNGVDVKSRSKGENLSLTLR